MTLRNGTACRQPAGAQFQVNLPAQNIYDQLQPRILGLNGGAFVIAYTDNNNADGNSLRRAPATLRREWCRGGS